MNKYLMMIMFLCIFLTSCQTAPVIDSANSMKANETKMINSLRYCKQVFSKGTGLPIDETVWYFDIAAGPRIGLDDYWEVGGVAGLGLSYLGGDIKRELFNVGGFYTSVDLNLILHIQYFQYGFLLLSTLEIPDSFNITAEVGICSVNGFNSKNYTGGDRMPTYFLPVSAAYFDAGIIVTHKVGEMSDKYETDTSATSKTIETKYDILLGISLMYRKEISDWKLDSFIPGLLITYHAANNRIFNNPPK